MRKRKNDDPKFLGQRYGRLTVIGFTESTVREGSVAWVCRCDCGNNITVNKPGNVKCGQTKSCGCLKDEQNIHNLAEKRRTHGMSETRLFRIWEKMRDRCNNPNVPAYKNYGGRGIKVCNEWDESFVAFYEWAIAAGYNDELTIERVDNDKGYGPDNCCWITREEQQRNKRNIRFVELDGERIPLKTACDRLGVSYKAVHLRITRHGWDVERALYTPVGGRGTNQFERK